MTQPKFRTTETITFRQCPTKWWYARNGWRGKSYGSRDVAAAIGTAIHAGTAHIDRCDMRGESVSLTYLNESLPRTLENHLDALAKYGPESQAAATMMTKAHDKYARAIEVYYESQPLEPYEIIEVELTMPNYGGTTLDRAVVRSDGAVGVIDLKTRRFSSDYYKRKFLDEFAQSWQMKHYSWAYEERSGRNVTWYGVLLCDLRKATPTYEVHEFPYDEVTKQRWRASAFQTWEDMDATLNGRRPLVMAAECHDRYGRCEFFRACYVHHGDTTKMLNDYVREGNEKQQHGIDNDA